MQVEILSADKLKITLTESDLDDFDIDIDELCYDTERAGDFFWNLLSDIDEEIDFFKNDCHLMIEALSAQEDCFVMIITRVDATSGGRARAKVRKKNEQIPVVIYSFEDISYAAQGCKRISVYYNGKSRLYKYEGKYYLAIHGVNSFIAKDSDVMLSDYGTKTNNGTEFEGFLAEKGEFLIKEDAVEILCSYF